MSQKKFDEADCENRPIISRRKPEFAEAYNQRALAYFLKGDYEHSTMIVNRLWNLNPIHFGAQSGGMGECFYKLQQYDEAKNSLGRGSEDHSSCRWNKNAPGESGKCIART